MTGKGLHAYNCKCYYVHDRKREVVVKVNDNNYVTFSDVKYLITR